MATRRVSILIPSSTFPLLSLAFYIFDILIHIIIPSKELYTKNTHIIGHQGGPKKKTFCAHAVCVIGGSSLYASTFVLVVLYTYGTFHPSPKKDQGQKEKKGRKRRKKERSGPRFPRCDRPHRQGREPGKKAHHQGG